MELFGRLPHSDLEELAVLTSKVVKENQSVNIVIVGASGFLGRWLSTFFTFLQSTGEFKGTVSLLVRNSSKISELQSLSNPSNHRVIQIKSLSKSSFNHLTADRIVVFFAATSTSLTVTTSEGSLSTATLLAEKVISSLPNGNLTFIHLSSGGIYEPSARQLNSIPKEFKTQKTGMDAYTQEKIDLEKWTIEQENQGRFRARNPRLFTFYGPGLQLDRHFAIGEFMARGKSMQDVVINGNPENLRSYLYPTDAIWQLLQQTELREPTYSQVGSSDSTTIAETGIAIASMYGVNFEISNQQDQGVNNYVPQDVPTFEIVNFSEGLNRWRMWLDFGYH